MNDEELVETLQDTAQQLGAVNTLRALADEFDEIADECAHDEMALATVYSTSARVLRALADELHDALTAPDYERHFN